MARRMPAKLAQRKLRGGSRVVSVLEGADLIWEKTKKIYDSGFPKKTMIPAARDQGYFARPRPRPPV
jgi:hypothetical protein